MPSAAQIAFDPRKVLDSPDFKVLSEDELKQVKPTDNVRPFTSLVFVSHYRSELIFGLSDRRHHS